MAFLLAAARKMQLKRQINSKSYEQALIGMKLEEATKKVQEKQQAIQDMTNNFKNGTSLFTQMAQVAAANQLSAEQRQDATIVSQAMTKAQTAGQTLATAVNSIFDSVVGTQQKAELARLQAQESSLNLRKEGLELELNLLKEEYQSYSEACKEGIKDAVPHFGLA